MLCWADETHKMMSGTIAAPAPPTFNSRRTAYDPTSRPVFSCHAYARCIRRLERYPGRRSHPFWERLHCLSIPRRQGPFFVPPAHCRKACAHGDMDALIIMGLTPAGLKVLQAYVDRSGIKSYFSFVPNFGTWKRLQRK